MRIVWIRVRISPQELMSLWPLMAIHTTVFARCGLSHRAELWPWPILQTSNCFLPLTRRKWRVVFLPRDPAHMSLRYPVAGAIGTGTLVANQIRKWWKPHPI